jgi:hypothetical protein
MTVSFSKYLPWQVIMSDVLMGFHWSPFSKPNTEFYSDLAPCDFWAFPTTKREAARNFEVINGLQHVLEEWVERCKKCIACRGRYFEKRPSPHLHKVPTRSNKVSPRTFQTALVLIYKESFRTELVGIFMVYLHTKFRMRNLSGSLRIATYKGYKGKVPVLN